MARRQAGVTLVELMIALVLGTLVLLGLITLMNSVGQTNRVQDGMARMQENGRYALQRISEDLRAASSQYCSNFGAATGRDGSGAAGTAEYLLEQPRAIVAHYDVGTNLKFGPIVASAPPLPPAVLGSANATYLISPRWMLFGSECGTATCAPAVNAANRGTDLTIFSGARATMGVNNGNRARGADTLSIRYIRGAGVPVTAVRNNELEAGNLPVEVDANSAALGITDTTIGQVLVTDCAVGDVLRMRAGGGTLTAANNYQNDVMQAPNPNSDPRVFNLDRDLVQVSYFLQVKDDPNPNRNPATRKIVVLMRSENGVAQEIVEGVERLDFMYAVDDNLGRTQYLTATQVDAMAAACPPSPYQPSGYTANYFGAPEPGCGWRAVKSVEVSLLMNTVSDAALTSDEAFRYSWTNAGVANTGNTYEIPSALGTMRSGLPPYRMLRREFRAQVGVRGYNY
ncbi:MAG TPA: PilW family protein [Xanthomonadales bacterium]|nr:PilW family protein [Xanthomonadales bacterium]